MDVATQTASDLDGPTPSAPMGDASAVEGDAGCMAFCMDLTFLGNEPVRFLESRIMEAHRRLFHAGSTLEDAPPSSEVYTIVHPKMASQPLKKRTGSFVLETSKKWGTVDTASTVDTACSSSSRWPQRNEAELCLVDLDDQENRARDESRQPVVVEDYYDNHYSCGVCSWGYFVDAVAPDESPDRRETSYRGFLHKDIESNQECPTDLQLTVE